MADNGFCNEVLRQIRGPERTVSPRVNHQKIQEQQCRQLSEEQHQEIMEYLDSMLEKERARGRQLDAIQSRRQITLRYALKTYGQNADVPAILASAEGAASCVRREDLDDDLILTKTPFAIDQALAKIMKTEQASTAALEDQLSGQERAKLRAFYDLQQKNDRQAAQLADSPAMTQESYAVYHGHLIDEQDDPEEENVSYSL